MRPYNINLQIYVYIYICVYCIQINMVAYRWLEAIANASKPFSISTWIVLYNLYIHENDPAVFVQPAGLFNKIRPFDPTLRPRPPFPPFPPTSLPRIE